MNKVQYILFLSFIILSCKDNIIKKNIDQQIITKDTITYTINNLPSDRYALITCIFDIYDSERILNRDPTLEIFDRRSKNKQPEKPLKKVYYSNDDNHGVMYADFNFDGKMDLAFTSTPSIYHNFYHYNFYLATKKGYSLNKKFSEIMAEPIAFLTLDYENKKICASREFQFHKCWVYTVKDSKLKLIKINGINQ